MTNSKKILFIEDDPIMHKLVKHSLGADFEITSCFSLAEADKLLNSNISFSAILVDKGLPDGDGLSICFSVRQQSQLQNTPILFLSGATNEMDKVSAFLAGADDYITKPFGLLELKARLQARLKSNVQNLKIGTLEINLDSHRVYQIEDSTMQELELTRIEYKILTTLAQSLDQVFSRETLLSKVWGNALNVSDRVVDSHVSHLRKKISNSQLKLLSLRGEGYKMIEEAKNIKAA